MVGPCLCGDTECPSCGPLQGVSKAPDTDYGGPAFPVADFYGQGYPAAGMTLRDYFAAHALAALSGGAAFDFKCEGTQAHATLRAERVARHAYEIADAMIEAREGAL